MEWIESIKENFSFSDVIAFLSMTGAIIAAIMAWKSKRKAAKSEAQAELYAKNADDANQSAKKYYDSMYKHLETQNSQNERAEKKRNILIEINKKIVFSAQDIMHTVGLTEDETIELLNEIETIQPSSLSEDRSSINCNWQKNKR